ncbi:MAG: hypothetical protein M9949_00035 [Candidatus Kapabacteria bacterium]|nr:hypothetical protein [Candidatus Kapabacteria bacterium]
MEQKEINLQKIIKVLFFIIMTFSCAFGILSTIYFEVYFSLLFFLPPLISAAYLFYAYKKYDLTYISYGEKIVFKKYFSLILIFEFILGFSILPISNWLFGDPITAKTLYLSVILGLIFITIPFIVKRKPEEAKS